MSQQISFIVAFAAVFGSAEAIRQTQARTRRQEHRSRKNNLVVHCPKSSKFAAQIEGRHVTLSGEKLYIDTGVEHDIPFGHPFAGYYLPFPETPFEGLVTTISDDPPIMNWVYVDRETYEVKFGTRPWAEVNFKGPFDCTRQDRRLTLGGWEGFVAVQEGDFWALYFDLDGDRLQSKVPEGTPVLDIELQRIEMRTPKPIPKEETKEDSDAETKVESDVETKVDSNADVKEHFKAESEGNGEEEKIQGDLNGITQLESPEVD